MPRAGRTLLKLLSGLQHGSLSLHANAASLPAPLQKAYPDLTARGEGRLTWFGLRIYTATLWSSAQPFDPRRPSAPSDDRARCAAVRFGHAAAVSPGLARWLAAGAVAGAVAVRHLI